MLDAQQYTYRRPGSPTCGSTIPEPENQRANRQRRGSKGGRPAGFGTTIYMRVTRVE
ncbi:hypothetical protein AB0A81_40840 [Streptomyces flaveolus]|uniref:Transposase n=1 Tax=Streptomyces flaveolus TaxID=67297 RepID=A0ABV1VIL2_9ACTN